MKDEGRRHSAPATSSSTSLLEDGTTPTGAAHVARAEAERILDRAARRILAEKLAKSKAAA